MGTDKVKIFNILDKGNQKNKDDASKHELHTSCTVVA